MDRKRYAVQDHITGSDIKSLRKRLSLSQSAFAELVGVSLKTVERWEYSNTSITGPMVLLRKLLIESPDAEERIRIPKRTGNLRLWYMYRDDVCTIMDIDEKDKLLHIYNYTNRLQFRAFGINEHPTYEDLEEFLESRCFPRTRDKMKIMLNALDIPFYDPMTIIEKTQGRMAEDDFWLRIER